MVDRRIIATIKTFVHSIPEEYGLKKVYLFGSFAKGLQTEGSDIDLALILKKMPDFFAAQRDLMRLRRAVDLRIEPHPIEEQDFTPSNPFAFEIQKTGIEIPIDK